MLSPVTLLCTAKKECVFYWVMLLSLGLLLYQSNKLVQNGSHIFWTKSDNYGTKNGQRDFSESTTVSQGNHTTATKPLRTNLKEEEEETKKRTNTVKFNITERQLNEVMSKPECQNVTQNARSWWKTKYLDNRLSADDDFSRISSVYQCGGLLFLEDYKLTSPREPLYPFENEYFQYPPLADAMDIINENFTTVELLNNSKTFKVGDTVDILIHARDFHNKLRTKGGDEIRVWLKTHLKKTANRVAATVVDLKNGSYVARALLPWAGQLRLFVALAYPSEHIRAILRFHQIFKGLKMMVGKFQKANASEVTPCYHAPVIPGFSHNEKLCNLTSQNGSPWFCGAPLKKWLSCEDYKFTRVVDGASFKAMTDTEAEYDLLQRSDRPPRKRIISSSQYLTVEPNSGQMSMAPSKEMCHSIDPRKTWKPEEPRGFFFEGSWRSFICARLDTEKRECLKDKNIITLGDSNARAHYDYLRSKIGCKSVWPRTTKVWHKPLKCVNKAFNTEISWYPHSQPFISSTARWASIEHTIPSVHILDKVPFDDRQHWVILHHYIHLTSFHLSSFEVKTRAIKDAISRLLDRQPNVRVVVQGIHIAWEGWTKYHYTAGDQLGKFISQIQRDVFQDLQDKVFFAPFWDFTTAMENTSFHPNGNGRMSKIILGYLCDK